MMNFGVNLEMRDERWVMRDECGQGEFNYELI